MKSVSSQQRDGMATALRTRRRRNLEARSWRYLRGTRSSRVGIGTGVGSTVEALVFEPVPVRAPCSTVAVGLGTLADVTCRVADPWISVLPGLRH